MDTEAKVNYVLVDFENVQPKNLSMLNDDSFRVFVFVGENQAKIPFDVASAMQKLGERGHYVKIAGAGKNALDFHIALYLGELAARDRNGYFHVISRDTGFDPLITHLRQRGLHAHREQDIAEIPPLRVPAGAATSDKVTAIIKNLAGRGASRPRKVRTLSNTIASLFKPKLENSEISAIVEELKAHGYVVVNGDNVAYRLPK
jgi:hypothetical protein